MRGQKLSRMSNMQKPFVEHSEEITKQEVAKYKRLNLTQPDSTRLNSTQLDSNQLNLTQLNQLDSTELTTNAK